jgi:tRNA A-37 threonylcarbamoyl transferase component Bud32
MQSPLATDEITPPPESLTGRDLNHYRIGPLLGTGGMAEVYRARDTLLQRDVAIKVLRSAHLFDRERIERLYREARLLASLNHPNIATVYGFEEAGGICALVLELVEGDTLSERIARGRVAPDEAAAVAAQIAAALDAAHAKGIIHRDLKPSNIKIRPNGIVKVLDFGIAKLLHSSNESHAQTTTISRRGVVLGTIAYMSPEQARGRTIDVRTDIWAFGCILYELLTGSPAFQGESSTDIVIKIATEQPDWSRFASLADPGSAGLQRIARKCMQKELTARYTSVSDLVADLDALGREPDSIASAKPALATDVEFVLPGKPSWLLFLIAQLGYLILYTAAMYHIEAVGRILSSDFSLPGSTAVVTTIILAMCGIAVRLYLISAVGWRHPDAGKKFERLFPLLLILDSVWAASPLLLWRLLGYGIAFVGVAMLTYVPFSQRTLMRSIYPSVKARR